MASKRTKNKGGSVLSSLQDQNLGPKYIAPFAALGISFVSGLTTFFGFTHLIPTLAAALIITIAVQLSLLYAANELGKDFAFDRRPRRPIIAIFLLSLLFSVAFSYVTFYDELFDQGARKVERGDEAIKVADRTRDGVRRTLERNIISAESQLSKSGGLSDNFTNRMNGAADQLEANWAEFEEDRRAARARAVTMRAQREGEAARATESLAGLERSLEAANTALTDAGAARNRASGRISELSSSVAEMKDEEGRLRSAAEFEKAGAAGTGLVGEGPEFRRITREADAVLNNLRRQETALEEARSNLSAADSQIAQRSDEVTRLSERIAIERAAVADLQGRKEPDGDEPAVRSTSEPGTPEDLRDRVVEFGNRPTLALLESLEIDCRTLSAQLVKSGEKALNCDVGELQLEISQLTESEERLATFDAECGDLSTSGLEFQAAVDYSRGCLRIAKLSANQSESFNDEISSLVRNRSENANMFTVAWTALSELSILAVGAMIFAVFVDMMILILGFLRAYGGGDADPTAELRRMLPRDLAPTERESQRKALDILARAESFDDGETTFDFSNPKSLRASSNDIRRMRSYIGRLVGMDLARQVDRDIFAVNVHVSNQFHSMLDDMGGGGGADAPPPRTKSSVRTPPPPADDHRGRYTPGPFDDDFDEDHDDEPIRPAPEPSRKAPVAARAPEPLQPIEPDDADDDEGFDAMAFVKGDRDSPSDEDPDERERDRRSRRRGGAAEEI